MALPQKLNASDVKGWAKKKLGQPGKMAVKAAGKKPKFGKGAKDPGKAKAPADDPTKIQQPVANKKDEDQEEGGHTVSVHVHTGKPNTEPQDPMNAGGPEVPEEFLDDMKGTEDDEDAEDMEAGESVGGNPEIEEKLGEFAEVLEHRVGELEELAADVEGNLLDEEIDVETKREAQALIPDDLRQDLVETLSALSDEEIAEYCQHLASQGRIGDPDLVAGFLRAAVGDSAEDDEDEEDGIPGTDQELEDDEEADDVGEGEESDEDFDEEDADVDTGEDDEEEDDEDEDEEEDKPPAKKSKKPPLKKPLPKKKVPPK